MTRFKILMVLLGAVVALSVAAGTAQAARPVQPQFTKNGETIKENLTIEGTAQRLRMWTVSAGILIRCEKGTAQGTIGPKGIGNGVGSSKECKVFSPTENAKKQWEEGEELTACSVSGGEINPRPVKTQLVWVKGENKVQTLSSPLSGSLFVTVVITGATCVVKGTFEVTGSELNPVWIVNEPELMGGGSSDAVNGHGEVRQLFREWEVENEGVKESGTAELKLGAKVAASEGVAQTELARQGNKRALLGVTE